MTKLLDFLTFKDKTEIRTAEAPDPRSRKDERDTAILDGKAPASAAEIEIISEYRLASLMQYPHY